MSAQTITTITTNKSVAVDLEAEVDLALASLTVCYQQLTDHLTDQLTNEACYHPESTDDLVIPSRGQSVLGITNAQARKILSMISDEHARQIFGFGSDFIAGLIPYE